MATKKSTKADVHTGTTVKGPVSWALHVETTERLIEQAKRLEQSNEGLRSALLAIDRDLKDEQKARAATQELLDACLSADSDARHPPAAVVVRNLMAAMLRRNGWLDPDAANALKRELHETKHALVIAGKRMEAADIFGVNPGAVIVSADGACAVAPLGPTDLALASAPKAKSSKLGKQARDRLYAKLAQLTAKK